MDERFLRLNAAECCRLYRPTAEATADAFEAHLLASQAWWNYEVSREQTSRMYAGVPVSDAMRACERITNAVGRAQNELVISIVHAFLGGRRTRCLPLPRRPLRFRRDLICWLRPDGLVIEEGRLAILWLQPRKLFAHDDDAKGMFAAMLLNRYSRDTDYAGAGVEFIDCSAPKPAWSRAPRLLGLTDLPSISDDELQRRLQVIARAIDIVRERQPLRPEDEASIIQRRLFE